MVVLTQIVITCVFFYSFWFGLFTVLFVWLALATHNIYVYARLFRSDYFFFYLVILIDFCASKRTHKTFKQNEWTKKTFDFVENWTRVKNFPSLKRRDVQRFSNRKNKWKRDAWCRANRTANYFIYVHSSKTKTITK